jgi:UDP-glucose 4-epimerase
LKILITGGAGYIGAHTVRELIVQGYEVVIVDTLERGHLQQRLHVPFYQGSITDAAFLEGVFERERPDAVIHFAAYKAPGESMQNPISYFRNNVCGSLTLFETMLRHNVTSLVFSSSCSIFGNPVSLPVSEDAPLQPESVYGESKLMTETMLRWLDTTRGLKSSSLRYFNASGASFDAALGEDWTTTSNLIPLVMKAALGKAPFVTIFGNDYPTRDGTAVRDYVHVVDLALAHIQALEQLLQTRRSTTYNLGTGVGSTVQEVVMGIKRISGIDFPIQYAPRRPGDPVIVWADSRKVERELRWKARYDLETILHTAWQWHSTHPEGV